VKLFDTRVATTTTTEGRRHLVSCHPPGQSSGENNRL